MLNPAHIAVRSGRPGAGVSPWTLISSATVVAGSGGTTPAIDTTGADLIVVTSAWGTSGNSASISDNKSNSWTSALGQASLTATLQTWYKVAPTVGTGHTVTFVGNSTFASIIVQAWKGSKSVTPIDVQNTFGAAALTNSTTTGSVTPTLSNDLVLAVFASSGVPSPTIDSGMTIGTIQNTAGGYTSAIAYKTSQAAGVAINPTWTWATAASHNAGGIIAFKTA